MAVQVPVLCPDHTASHPCMRTPVCRGGDLQGTHHVYTCCSVLISLLQMKKKRNNNNTFNKNTKPSVFACMLRCPKLKAVHSPSQSRQPFNSVASLYRLACIAEKITVSNSHQMSKIKSFITSDIQLTPSKPPLWPQTYKQETTYPCNLICA